MASNWKIQKKISKKGSKELASYPPIVRQLLFNRGIDGKEADKFLDPDNVQFNDPYKIYHIEKAARIILDFIEQKKKIFIHGDYDVDGICATAILWDFLYRKLEADVLPYVPSRFEEGYGMTDASLKKIREQGGEVVITVDCGIRDEELIRKWSKKGLEFIITDHHEFEEELIKPNEANLTNVCDKYRVPNSALAVVHPRHPKGKYPFGEISGATVAWKLVIVLVKEKALDFDPDVYLDLVALSTVCDIMPLVDENRSIVKSGLKQMRQTDRIGLRRLIYDAGLVPEQIETYHLGFVIGPRLNAAGRLEHAIDAIRLLATKSQRQAREISEKLTRLNQRRQRIQEEIYKKALDQIQQVGIERKLYFVWDDEWKEGVIGIVAGKISEVYHRPVLIATRKGTSYTGSGRSTERFNIIEAINSQSKLLERFGGHPQAAGFTVATESIEQFRDNLLEIADKDLSDEDILKERVADCEISLDDIDWELLGWMERFAPFGFKNSKPRFISRRLHISDVDLVGSSRNHLRLAFLNKNTGEYFKGIGFGIGEEFKDLKIGDKIDVLFTLERNEWNGEESLQLNVKDIKISQKSRLRQGFGGQAKVKGQN